VRYRTDVNDWPVSLPQVPADPPVIVPGQAEASDRPSNDSTGVFEVTPGSGDWLVGAPTQGEWEEALPRACLKTALVGKQ
jgi:hypothetical protein